jgi:hypothetical protein
MKKREQRSAMGSLAYQRCEQLGPEMITDREFVAPRETQLTFGCGPHLLHCICPLAPLSGAEPKVARVEEVR